MWLFFAFLAVPLIEIALFIQVGGAIGLLPTLLIVVATAILGTFLVRQQGLMALGQIQSNFQNLKDPTEPLAHGAMILFSGALLLTPGFFTDAVGFSLLIPGVRHAAYNWIRQRNVVQGFSTQSATHATNKSDTIETEYYEVSTDEENKGPSGWTKH